ncbi:hypothetical protein HY950_01910 [Candidatus Gottesmanbacteria bacterium]|nr:hypothetical protein [Candidatus Gottesmanbacteria bacterium]
MSVFTLARHLFLPHHTNNHRPKVLHVDALGFYILAFVVFQVGLKTLPAQVPNVLGYATDIHVEKLLAAVNAKRQVAGLGPLSLDSQLSEAAARKAADMFAKNYWAHNSPVGATPWEFITQSGYTYTVAGENLAKNFSDSQGVVEAWMASPTHRDNMLKASYRDVGFAVVNGILNGEETTLVVQMFGSRAAPAVQVRKTTEVSPQAAVAEATPPLSAVTAVASAYSGVSIKPLIDIGRLNHTVVYGFIGILLGVLVVDAWLTSRRRIVRVAGHNVAHILFFVALLIFASALPRGSLL